MKKSGGRAEAAAPAGRRLAVFVRFTGDLDKIKANGFAVQSVEGNLAIGTVEIEDVEKIAALDNVVFIQGTRRQRAELKVSVPEMRANRVWVPPLSLQGEGVIVGIVDTGIDIFHQAFRSRTAARGSCRSSTQRTSGLRSRARRLVVPSLLRSRCREPHPARRLLPRRRWRTTRASVRSPALSSLRGRSASTIWQWPADRCPQHR